MLIDHNSIRKVVDDSGFKDADINIGFIFFENSVDITIYHVPTLLKICEPIYYEQIENSEICIYSAFIKQMLEELRYKILETNK
jgi:hypothetical protein